MKRTKFALVILGSLIMKKISMCDHLCFCMRSMVRWQKQDYRIEFLVYSGPCLPLTADVDRLVWKSTRIFEKILNTSNKVKVTSFYISQTISKSQFLTKNSTLNSKQFLFNETKSIVPKQKIKRIKFIEGFAKIMPFFYSCEKIRYYFYPLRYVMNMN